MQITPDLLREVEQFLYREARLLDDRQLHQWVELLAEDLRYWMPMRSNIYPANSKAIASLDEAQQEQRELTEPHELAVMDETRETLRRRIERLDSGLAWAEDPAVTHPPLHFQRGTGTHGQPQRGKGLFQLHHVPHPGRAGRGLLRGPAGKTCCAVPAAGGCWPTGK